MILTKLDHVIEMMTTAGKKVQNFLWSHFLIIVQNVNMVTNAMAMPMGNVTVG